MALVDEMPQKHCQVDTRLGAGTGGAQRRDSELGPREAATLEIGQRSVRALPDEPGECLVGLSRQRIEIECPYPRSAESLQCLILRLYLLRYEICGLRPP